jgi:hypothetical protein
MSRSYTSPPSTSMMCRGTALLLLSHYLHVPVHRTQKGLEVIGCLRRKCVNRHVKIECNACSIITSHCGSRVITLFIDKILPTDW